jgi:hypothetical protein
MCPITYIFVLVKIQVFKRKTKVEILPHNLPNHSKPLPSSLGNIFNASLANLATVAVSLLIVVPSMVLAVYLGTKDIDYLNKRKALVYLQFHGLPFIVTSSNALAYLISNRKMRDAIIRELQNYFRLKQ